ncbi:MAG: MG2 domain-containing protein [Acidobacteria bacterium]|nr:MG2 domain-containing protein [Acidobacteriota bacterium]
MKKIAPFLFLLSLFVVTAAQTPAGAYEELKQQAERLFDEGSYRRAHALYAQAEGMDLPAGEARWVSFRLADTQWRAQAATRTSDSTEFEEAREALLALIGPAQRPQDHDQIWAMAQQSLGDFWWLRGDSRNWGAAWTHYRQALDWWAQSKDLETARRHYLEIVWSISEPAWQDQYYSYGAFGNVLPLQILENVLKIAQDENDRTHAHYLLAMTLRNQGNRVQRQRVSREFEAALEGGPARDGLVRDGLVRDWYDDALFHYAQWMASVGLVYLGENNQWVNEPDFVKALELYGRLIQEYSKGETRYWDQANQQISVITSPGIVLAVSNIFLPDSEVQFHLNWRNVRQVDFTLYKVNLTDHIRFQRESSGWLEAITAPRQALTKSWSYQTEDSGDHQPGSALLGMGEKLPVGAYLLVASGNGKTTRELILVTDTSLVLKTQSTQALVYYCNALDGSPIANARVHLWQYSSQKEIWQKWEMTTNAEGIAVFDLAATSAGWQAFAFAAFGDRQAFSVGHTPYYSSDQSWRIYAFTDRPAYRPGETMDWKIVARREKDFRLSTPSQEIVEFQISDPQGAVVQKSTITLNAFGSAWGSLELTEAMPLGEYNIQFWDESRENWIGSAKLFRLEEYKLPEFQVSIQTPEDNGKKRVFRLGETVEVALQVDYYFGSPVAQAEVEVLIYQRPFYQQWRPQREYPWLYGESSLARGYYGGGRGQVIRREQIKTDVNGRALFSFETPANSNQDQEYEIEARVRDSSRREVMGRGTVRVTRQAYFAYLHPLHNLYRPQDTVQINIRSQDANDQPVQALGSVQVQRSFWEEIWIDPNGRQVEGERLRNLQAELAVFPPPVSSGRGWHLQHRGYKHEEILTRTVSTNQQGEAQLRFSPQQEGYYRILWTSGERANGTIRAETSVWVATGGTTELGYRHGGLEIILDKDTFRVGQDAPVMLTSSISNRYILFSLEAEDLYSYQLVHLSGTAKLIQVPIEEEHVPNLFLSAVMVSDRQIFMDIKEVIVPPVEHFLQVSVQTDREEYGPRQPGRITITTTDSQGNPVSTEVAVGTVDESVYAIQGEYASDPRQFFYGRKHQRRVQTTSSFQQKSYLRLVKGPEDGLIDERAQGNRDDVLAGGVVGGFMGGVVRSRLEAEMSMEFAENSAGLEVPMASKAMAAPSETLSQGQSGDSSNVQVRSDFRATALWRSHLLTGSDGKAVVNMKFPDSLTTWRTTVRAVGRDSTFGMATTKVRTNQPLVARLQAPRFFVVGDQVTLSAVINNNTKEPLETRTRLEADGLQILGLLRDGRIVQDEIASLRVEAGGQVRLDWIVSVREAGQARLSVVARADQYADAMEKTYPVYEHGIEKFLSRAGKMRSQDLTVHLNLPDQRKTGTTSVSVQLTPSLAVTMLDALPYLIDYPYGCTEQTMSRFLPAAITARTLQNLGLERDAILNRSFGGIVQEHASKTHPGGAKNLLELDDMIQQGLTRLYDFQHPDGGWGWWKEGDSDHFMTAYVVWGLSLGQEAGIEVRPDVLSRGVEYLDKEIVEAETRYDLQAWMLHALSSSHQFMQAGRPSPFQVRAFDNLWSARDGLNAYTRALLALSAHHYGYQERARILVRNLENGVKIDHSPESSALIPQQGKPEEESLSTAHWGEDGIFWRWSEGGVEATAFALKAMLKIDPANKLIEPVTNWLIKNRRGAQWTNTRDTAIVILAMNDYLRESGELEAEVEYEVRVNDQLVVSRRVTPQDVLSAPSRFTIDPGLIHSGDNEIRILKTSGQSPLYFSVQAQFFSLEEPVAAAGNEIFVHRRYYKLVPQQTLLNGYIHEKQPLEDGENVLSGERVEVVMTIEAKNNFEYLVFEDLKPAGLEAVAVKSGGPLYATELKSGAVKTLSEAEERDASDYTGRSRWVYRELRDRKVAFFIDKLPEGVWEIRYQLRAEVPGHFHALPVLGHAMYVPEIRCSSEEIRIDVRDQR